MTTTAFDPGALTADAASINHVVLGSMAEPDVRGRLAQDTCCRNALHTLATTHGLTNVRHGHLADDLATAIASGDAQAADRAVTTLRTFGTHIGALIATLRDPETAGRQATSAARRGFFEHWLTVDSIWLGGGLLVGRCGPPILGGVNSVARYAVRPCDVGVLHRPEFAPLIGAARSGTPAAVSETVVVADLGHTNIKTAVAHRSGATLAGLRRIGSFRAPVSATADELEDAVAAALIPVVKAAAARGDRIPIIVSVASFVQDGVPVDDGQGIYGCLGRRTAALLRQIEAATGVAADLRYLHDGTAAARASGATNSATLTVGTWLGVGFVPHDGATSPETRQPQSLACAAPIAVSAPSIGTQGAAQ